MICVASHGRAQGWFHWEQLDYSELSQSHFVSRRALKAFRIVMFLYALFVCIYTAIYQDFTSCVRRGA